MFHKRGHGEINRDSKPTKLTDSWLTNGSKKGPKRGKPGVKTDTWLTNGSENGALKM